MSQDVSKERKKRVRVAQSEHPEIVKQHFQDGRSLSSIARDLDVTPATIHYIVKRYKQGTEPAQLTANKPDRRKAEKEARRPLAHPGGDLLSLIADANHSGCDGPGSSRRDSRPAHPVSTEPNAGTPANLGAAPGLQPGKCPGHSQVDSADRRAESGGHLGKPYDADHYSGKDEHKRETEHNDPAIRSPAEPTIQTFFKPASRPLDTLRSRTAPPYTLVYRAGDYEQIIPNLSKEMALSRSQRMHRDAMTVMAEIWIQIRPTRPGDIEASELV